MTDTPDDLAASTPDDIAVSPDSPVRTFVPSKQSMQLVESRLVAAKFGNLVTILMQSAHHKDLRLDDLRHRIVPPLMNDQLRIAEARPKESGHTIPVGLIVWARVSDEIHERLLESLEGPIELADEEWSSGENYWIIDAVGQQRFLAPLLTDLRKTDLRGKTVHYRATAEDGIEIKTMQG